MKRFLIAVVCLGLQSSVFTMDTSLLRLKYASCDTRLSRSNQELEQKSYNKLKDSLSDIFPQGFSSRPGEMPRQLSLARALMTVDFKATQIALKNSVANGDDVSDACWYVIQRSKDCTNRDMHALKFRQIYGLFPSKVMRQLLVENL